MRPNLLSIEVRGFVNAGRWGDRGDNFAVIRWRLHRLKVAFTVAHDVKGDAHGVREGVSLPAGFVLGHGSASSLRCQVVLSAGSSRAPFPGHW